MLQVLHDLEKIGDYAENIAVYTEKAIDNKMEFTEAACQQIAEMFDVAIRFTENTLREYHAGNFPRKIDTEDENTIDQLRKVLKNEHMSRLHEGLCSVETGILFVDILNNLEKTGDQVFNVAQIVMGDV
jgi:phosphate:Na+ symporter